MLCFCFTSMCDWLRKLPPLSQVMVIRFKTQTNHNLFSHVYSAQAICSEFSLASLDFFFIYLKHFQSQDLTSNSPYCMPYNLYDVSLENLIFLFTLITFHVSAKGLYNNWEMQGLDSFEFCVLFQYYCC